jgi:hypothetical protein
MKSDVATGLSFATAGTGDRSGKAAERSRETMAARATTVPLSGGDMAMRNLL